MALLEIVLHQIYFGESLNRMYYILYYDMKSWPTSSETRVTVEQQLE